MRTTTKGTAPVFAWNDEGKIRNTLIRSNNKLIREVYVKYNKIINIS